MAWATSAAMSAFSGRPSWMVDRRVFAVSLGRYFFITSVLKTSAP